MPALARLGGRLPLLGKAPLARSSPRGPRPPPRAGTGRAPPPSPPPPRASPPRSFPRSRAPPLLRALQARPEPARGLGLAHPASSSPSSRVAAPTRAAGPTGGPDPAGGLAEALPGAGAAAAPPARLSGWPLGPRARVVGRQPESAAPSRAPGGRDLACTDPGYRRLVGGVFNSSFEVLI